MNKITPFLACLLFSFGAFAEEIKSNEAKEMLVNSHVEYAKSEIDRKCQKMKKKINSLYRKLHNLNRFSSGEDFNKEQQEEINRRINKYEDRIENLKLMKISLDTINFNAF